MTDLGRFLGKEQKGNGLWRGGVTAAVSKRCNDKSAHSSGYPERLYIHAEYLIYLLD